MSADNLYENANQMVSAARVLGECAGQLITDALDMWQRVMALPPAVSDLAISPFIFTDCAKVPAPLSYISEAFEGGGIVLIKCGLTWYRVYKSASAIIDAQNLDNGIIYSIKNPAVKIVRVAFAQKVGA